MLIPPHDPAASIAGRTGMTRAPRRRLAADESGATAIEYALFTALIAGVLIGIVATMGQTVGGLFNNAETELLEHIEDTE